MALPQPAAGSDWTTETLRQHMIELFAARDRAVTMAIDAVQRELEQRDLRYQQRYDAQTQALEAARLAAAKANEVALTAAEKAVDKAETAASKRFDSVNEFRQQLADQATTFMPRGEAETRLSTTTEKLEDVAEMHRRDMVLVREMADRLAAASDERIKSLEAAASNMQGRLWALGVALAAVVILVNIAIRFVA